MRSSLSVRDLAEWLECLTANDEIATVLGSIPASFDTVESGGSYMLLFRVVAPAFLKEK
jgi:hypothetical protein